MEKNAINIREIAKRAGCSPSTVSRVLAGKTGSVKISEKTSERVRQVCAELDYQPSIHAARLFSGRSRVIGFLSACLFLPEDDNFGKSFFYLCEELSKHGYRLLPLLNTASFREEKEYLNVFKRNEIDALIVWGAQEKDTFLQEIRDAGYPFLLMTNKVGDFPAVYSEQQTPVAELTRACVSRGAKRIAAVMGRAGFCFAQRRNGFQQAVRECGIESREWFLPECQDSGLHGSAHLAPEIIAWKPDAVICCNDETAVGIARCCISRGIRIPGELMIAGGDNITLSEYSQIPLTTFDQMAKKCAGTAAKIILAHLLKNKPLYSEEISSKIIWRRSLPKPGRV